MLMSPVSCLHVFMCRVPCFGSISSLFSSLSLSLSLFLGWDRSIPTMCLGERSRFTISPCFGYGVKGNASLGIPGGATLHFELELAKCEAAPPEATA